MTENKRFTISNHCRIKDETQIGFFNIANNIDAKRVCDLLNELHDENEQLKQTNQRLTIALKEIKEKTNIYLEMTKKGEDQP